MIILTYHNVLAHSPGAFNMLARKEWIPLHEFEKQMAALEGRYRVVPLREIANAVEGGTVLPDACAITFDDGNYGAYRYAAPLLEERGWPATFFIVTDRLDRDLDHDAFDALEAFVCLASRDRMDLAEIDEGVLSTDCDDCRLEAYRRLSKRLRQASPYERTALLELVRGEGGARPEAVARHLSHEAYQSFGWAEARDLVLRGFSIGSHSRTHVALSRLSEPERATEVEGSYRALEAGLGSMASEFAFSYPFGKQRYVSLEAEHAVRAAGYAFAVTMEPAQEPVTAPLFHMPRVVYKDLKKLDRG